MVPTVKVPVTADTLQKQANGEDVVLEAAEAGMGQSGSSGQGQSSPGPLTRFSAPTMASKSDAASALAASAPYLEGKASEQYQPSDFAKPGTVTYGVTHPYRPGDLAIRLVCDDPGYFEYEFEEH